MQMEDFFKMRAEKQDHIINAAFKVFTRQGYRKASAGDIAKEAGISKGMITYYFGSKKNLYSYLLNVSQTRLIDATKEHLTPDVTDFFEKLKILTSIQISAIKEHPALVGFLNSIYSETAPEVKDELNLIYDTDYTWFDSILLTGTDYSKFKAGFCPQQICKFIYWADYGFLSELYDKDFSDAVDKVTSEFYDCLDLMKKTFYKDSVG